MANEGVGIRLWKGALPLKVCPQYLNEKLASMHTCILLRTAVLFLERFIIALTYLFTIGFCSHPY